VRLKVAPIAVHATYSLDNHDAVAKQQRFREAGLWATDPPSYYAGRYLRRRALDRLRALDRSRASRRLRSHLAA